MLTLLAVGECNHCRSLTFSLSLSVFLALSFLLPLPSAYTEGPNWSNMHAHTNTACSQQLCRGCAHPSGKYSLIEDEMGFLIGWSCHAAWNFARVLHVYNYYASSVRLYRFNSLAFMEKLLAL